MCPEALCLRAHHSKALSPEQTAPLQGNTIFLIQDRRDKQAFGCQHRWPWQSYYGTGTPSDLSISIGDRLAVVILFHDSLHDRLLGFCLFLAAVNTLLHVPQLVVFAFLGKQFLMGAALHDLAVIHHQDHVTVTDSGQAVSNDQHGTIRKLVIDHVEDQVFRCKVEVAGGLI